MIAFKEFIAGYTKPLQGQGQGQAQLPTPEEAAAMTTVDRLAQDILPRIATKLSKVSWQLERIEAYLQLWSDPSQCPEGVAATTGQMAQIMNEVTLMRNEMLQLKAKRSRKKKEVDAVPEPDRSEWADYDPDKDVWHAKMVGTVLITATVVEAVEAGDTAPYSPEVVDFVERMSEGARRKIKEAF